MTRTVNFNERNDENEIASCLNLFKFNSHRKQKNIFDGFLFEGNIIKRGFKFRKETTLPLNAR